MLFADLYSGQLYSIQASGTNTLTGGCDITPTPVAVANALISSILVINGEVIVCNVIGATYGLPIFFRLEEVFV